MREIWSFFSGGMGLDLGLESAGLGASLAVELDPWCCATIRDNRPHLTLLERDVNALSSEDLRRARNFKGEVFLMAGGPPCQSFCSGGKRAALSDPRGNLIYVYLRLVREISAPVFSDGKRCKPHDGCVAPPEHQRQTWKALEPAGIQQFNRLASPLATMPRLWSPMSCQEPRSDRSSRT